jgi:hypothetical protein
MYCLHLVIIIHLTSDLRLMKGLFIRPNCAPAFSMNCRPMLGEKMHKISTGWDRSIVTSRALFIDTFLPLSSGGIDGGSR